jgi:hypothetical protein
MGLKKMSAKRLSVQCASNRARTAKWIPGKGMLLAIFCFHPMFNLKLFKFSAHSCNFETLTIATDECVVCLF